MLYTQQDDSKFTTAELTTPLLLQCNICSTQQLEYKEMQLKSLKYIFSNYNLKQYNQKAQQAKKVPIHVSDNK